ncbi:TPR-like protein [Apiospora arundinis]|uniref:TPR-like protein n=1 Tax=Apiospora arundinis TaxID=335852 RepID=A0ABR2HME3_9PEZI
MSKAARERPTVSQQFGDAGASNGSRLFQGVVQGDLHLTQPPERSETPPKPTILIPFNRDRDFVSRDTILSQVHNLCSEPASRTALVGLGGVGKSQIAIEYAYRVREEQSSDTWVFWVHASSAARYEQGFRDIADYLKLPGRSNPQTNIFRLLYNWLRSEKSGKWVLILDNVDDASFLLRSPANQGDEQGRGSASQIQDQPLISYVPCCQHGAILITSRNRDAATKLVEPHGIIPVEPMNRADALSLVEKKLRLSIQDTQNDMRAAGSLVETLEYMPLAIVQAIAYISHKAPRCSVQQYVEMFTRNDKKKVTLLNYDRGQLRRDREAKNSITITWQISFEHIREMQPTATDMLSVMSFCDRQIDDSDSSSNGDDEFEDDIAILRDYSIISVNENNTFTMHRLVQLATRIWLEAEGQQQRWMSEFIYRLATQVPPNGEYENWATWQTLLPHVLLAATQRPEDEESLYRLFLIRYKASWYLMEIGRGYESQKMAEDVMKYAIKTFGRAHMNTLRAISLVARAHLYKGQWATAETLYRQYLEFEKELYKVDHSGTLLAMNNLAGALVGQGRWGEAQELQVQVLKRREEKLETDHPDTASSMHSLAWILCNQGRLEKAEEIAMQVIGIRKAKLGTDHPDTLTSMNTLAVILQRRGRLEEAEKLDIQVLESRKEKLGADHPDTLANLNNLALVVKDLGRDDEAISLMGQCVRLRKDRLGIEHPHYQGSLSILNSWEDERRESNLRKRLFENEMTQLDGL